jgi:hypothetical protein
MDNKGLGSMTAESKTIPIKCDSESGNSDTDDKIEVLNVKNGTIPQNGQ